MNMETVNMNVTVKNVGIEKFKGEIIVKIIDELKYRVEVSKYTLRHRRAFLKVEKELLGKNTPRGYLHDIEKPLLYMIVGKKMGSKIHKKISRHHNRAKTKQDRIQQIIDWECARYTKPDKPLDAVQTLYKMFPELKSEILPIMRELGLLEEII